MKEKTEGKIVKFRINEKLRRKVEKGALLSRRKEADVMRIWIEDGTLAQLGLREPENEKPAGEQEETNDA